MASKGIEFTAVVRSNNTTFTKAGRIVSTKLEPMIGKEVEVRVREKKQED